VARKKEQGSNWRYERLSGSLLPWPVFLHRAAAHLALAAVAIVLAVSAGTAGYHITADLSWIDAFLNASMILSGMGPVDRLETPAAKIFAACYALFSGLLFIAVMGVVLAPWAHRVLHKMHLDDDKDDKDSG
jgi:hypothetical protein